MGIRRLRFKAYSNWILLFAIFLPVLGKEYYKNSTCLDQKCSTWSAKPHGGHLFLLAPANKLLFYYTGGDYYTRGDWKQTLVARTVQPQPLVFCKSKG